MIEPSDLVERRRERPFVPFRMTTNSGETFEIRQPELFMVGESLVYVFKPSPRYPRMVVAGMEATVPHEHIATIENLEPESGEA